MRKSYSPYLVAAFLIVGSAAWLLLIGREPICKCGYVKLWHGETMSSENSQHLSDWYTPSHVIHGILFYWGLWMVASRIDIGWRFTLATLVECAWEILENSDAIIERYRTVTISLDYYGDSVVNATMDILAMGAGFWLARLIPVWASIATVIGFEVLTAVVIRDGLILNVIMLLWPIEAILDWQAGG